MKIRLFAALTAFLVGLLCLGWAFWPLPRQTLEWNFSPATLSGAGGRFLLPESRAASLSLPLNLRLEEEARAHLLFSSADSASPNLPAAWGECNPVAEARLEIPGLNLRPQGAVREPLTPGKNAVFYWSLYAAQAGEYEGKFWLYLTFFCPAEGQETRLALLSAPFLVRAPAIPWTGARWAGVLLLGLAVWLFLVPSIGPGQPAVREKKP